MNLPFLQLVVINEVICREESAEHIAWKTHEHGGYIDHRMLFQKISLFVSNLDWNLNPFPRFIALLLAKKASNDVDLLVPSIGIAYQITKTAEAAFTVIYAIGFEEEVDSQKYDADFLNIQFGVRVKR